MTSAIVEEDSASSKQAEGWEVESIEPSRYEVQPDLKDLTFNEGGRGRGSWW